MSELRLMQGDWVMSDSTQEPVYFDKVTREHYSWFCNEEGSNYTCWNDAISPLPLTPEILVEWFGFVRQGKWFWKRLGFYLFNETIEIFSMGQHGPEVRVELKYVHSLQHLYEALTGEPLKRIDL